MALDDSMYQRLCALSERNALLFWEDEAGAFAGDVAGAGDGDADGEGPAGDAEGPADGAPLELPGCEVLVVAGNALAIKRRVLVDAPDGRYLIYRAGGAPEMDFLRDIKLMAAPVSLSREAAWTEDLGLAPELEPVVAAHGGFFTARKRREDLARLLADADWTADGVDEPGLLLAMLCVCCRVRSPHAVDARRDIAARLVAEQALGRDACWQLVRRAQLEGALWEALRRAFGYQSEQPSVDDFSLALVASACAGVRDAEPELSSDADILLDAMANDPARAEAYEALIDATADAAVDAEALDAAPLEALVASRHLPAADDRIIRRLAAQALAGDDVAGAVADARRRRRGVHHMGAWEGAYRALEAAAQVLAGAVRTERELVDAGDAADLVRRYCGSQAAIDRAYRTYCLHEAGARRVEPDVFGQVGPRVEQAYARFCSALAAAWQARVLQAGCWPPTRAASTGANAGAADGAGTANGAGAGADALPYQADFFDEQVRPYLGGRVAVVVSDALRYEAGAQWAARRAARAGASVEARAMLCTLPSYTQLGMAALLPHGAGGLGLDPGTLTALVDGQPVAGTAARGKVLSAAVPGAVALRAQDARNASGAEALANAPLACVYHDHVDAVGDKAATESQTPRAVEDALGQVDELVDLLLGCGFKTVLVTADHGFLYQQDAAHLEYADVEGLNLVADAEGGERTRRFVAAAQVPPHDALMVFTASQLGLAGRFEVGVPRGTRRLRLQGGGARFVHGGLTLQETLVPLVRVSARRDARAARPVDASFLPTGARIIAGPSVRFDVYQSEPVGPERTAAAVRARFVDEAGAVVSQEAQLELDSAAAEAAGRVFSVSLAVAASVANGARLTLRLERRVRQTSRYETVDEAVYTVRRNFGMDF